VTTHQIPGPLAGLTADELMDLLPFLSEEERREIDSVLTAGAPLWQAQVGPQTAAQESLADVVFYGGSAGGGKTDLEIGLSLTEHEKSIIFRREAVQLVGIEERIAAILGSRKGYNSQDHIWRLPDVGGLAAGRTVELGSVKEPDDWMKYQGRPHDLICFDEITHFLEMQVRQLMGWKRTDNPKVRQRVIMAGNPPTNSDGEWVIRFFAPWLDPEHPHPAKPGELRWFVSDEEGRDLEVPNNRPVRVGGKWVKPHSRTFIPSSVKDNFFLQRTGYDQTLDALPEPFRSMMRDGNFQAGRGDDVWQVIPSEWVKAAQRRWQPRDIKGPMSAMGMDAARGGTDRSILARRHDRWVDELLGVPGTLTKDGPSGAAFALQHLRDGAPLALDTIGIGAAVLDFARQMGMTVHPVVASEGSNSTDKSGNLYFRNVRAEMYWRLREALDPTNPEPLSLPPDQELFQELIAQRYTVVTMGKRAAILLKPKDYVREVLGRSPDKSDAVAHTFVDRLPAAAMPDDVRAFRRARGYT
jgi:hypothetical protein